MSSATQTYGANIAFIEELYERFKNDPSSVSSSWREFFVDYRPELQEELEQDVAVGGAPGVAPPTSAPLFSPATPPPAQPAPPPAPPRAAAPHLAAVPSGANVTPLRGAASKIAQNMEVSLTIPTATSIRTIPVKALEENRRVINNHLALTGQSKAAISAPSVMPVSVTRPQTTTSGSKRSASRTGRAPK